MGARGGGRNYSRNVLLLPAKCFVWVGERRRPAQHFRCRRRGARPARVEVMLNNVCGARAEAPLNVSKGVLPPHPAPQLQKRPRRTFANRKQHKSLWIMFQAFGQAREMVGTPLKHTSRGFLNVNKVRPLKIRTQSGRLVPTSSEAAAFTSCRNDSHRTLMVSDIPRGDY